MAYRSASRAPIRAFVFSVSCVRSFRSYNVVSLRSSLPLLIGRIILRLLRQLSYPLVFPLQDVVIRLVTSLIYYLRRYPITVYAVELSKK